MVQADYPLEHNSANSGATFRYRRIMLFVTVSIVYLLSIFVVPFNRIQRYEPAAYIDIYEYYRQYNTDANIWVASIDEFPHFITATIRINRPVYIGVISFMTDVYGIFSNLERLNQVFAMMLLFNYLVYLAAVLGFYEVLRNWFFEDNIAFFAALMLALHGYWIRHGPALGPDAFTPLMFVSMIVLSLWQDTDRDQLLHTLLIALIAGIGVGLLMLVKAQYDIFIICMLLLLIRKRWIATPVMILAHFIPLLLWIYFLESQINIAYYNFEAQTYEQGVWVFEALSNGEILSLYKESAAWFGTAVGRFMIAFTPVTIGLAIYAWSRRDIAPKWLQYLTPLIIALITLFLIALQRPRDYLIFNMFIVIYPLAALGLKSLVKSRFLIIIILVMNGLLSWVIYTEFFLS